LQKPIGQTADTHDIGSQNEQRNRKQNVAVESHSVSAPPPCEIEPGQQQIEIDATTIEWPIGRPSTPSATIAIMQRKGLSGMLVTNLGRIGNRRFPPWMRGTQPGVANDAGHGEKNVN